MKCLVVGGTGFLGGAIVEALIADGHEVTVLSRGQTSRNLPANVGVLTADRYGDLSVLTGKGFDWVFDTCAFDPDTVERLIEIVGHACSRYVFISSLSVYGTFLTPGLDETAAATVATDAHLALAAGLSNEARALGESYGQSYGPLKRSCEIRSQEILGERATALRVGLLVGKGDTTDRLPWWVRRIDERSSIVVPGPDDRLVQIIDVADIAHFALTCAKKGLAGAWNVTGQPILLSDLVASIIEISSSTAKPVWVNVDDIVAAGIMPWTDIPLMVPEFPFLKHFFEVNTDKAIQNGLVCRPVNDTRNDILNWDRARRPSPLSAGMTELQEASLLNQQQRKDA